MRGRLLWAVALAGCGTGPPPPPPGPPWATLSEYGFFDGTGATQEPSPGVVPYEVNAVLFADFAWKHRFIVLPAGGRIRFEPTAPWGFPVGATILKTFSYPVDERDPSLGFRVVETRLLVLQSDGWRPHVYLWNASGTEATRIVAGARVTVSWIDRPGTARSHEYRVPNTNQCLGCHGQAGRTDLLGVRTGMVNRDFDYGAGPVNQIDHFESLGMFETPPLPPAARVEIPDPFGLAPLDARTRAYLFANCAHCHRLGGAAEATGLFLGLEVLDPFVYGVCRPPFSAGDATGGRRYDVVPGLPDDSIVVYRMESTDPAVHMPELPVQLVDPDGVALVRDWITQMSPAGCP